MITNLVKDTLALGHFGVYQTSALVFFFAIMIAVSIWIYMPGAKDYYDRVASDALRGDEHE